jgi:hypothetical protein
VEERWRSPELGKKQVAGVVLATARKLDVLLLRCTCCSGEMSRV